MELVILAAVSLNNVIGKDGAIPWDIPEDMKHFRRMTLSSPVIMGRKTYESIGKQLDDRLSIVITSRSKKNGRLLRFVRSLDDALYHVEHPKPRTKSIDYGTAYVIGGQDIYEAAMPLADRLEITKVKRVRRDGDATFPRIFKKDWELVSNHTRADYSFLRYVRRR